MKGSSSNLWFRLGAEQGAKEEAAAFRRWSSIVRFREGATVGERKEEQ